MSRRSRDVAEPTEPRSEIPGYSGGTEELGFSDFQADRATVGIFTEPDVNNVADVADVAEPTEQPTEPRSESSQNRM